MLILKKKIIIISSIVVSIIIFSISLTVFFVLKGKKDIPKEEVPNEKLEITLKENHEDLSFSDEYIIDNFADLLNLKLEVLFKDVNLNNKFNSNVVFDNFINELEGTTDKKVNIETANIKLKDETKTKLTDYYDYDSDNFKVDVTYETNINLKCKYDSLDYNFDLEKEIYASFLIKLPGKENLDLSKKNIIFLNANNDNNTYKIKVNDGHNDFNNFLMEDIKTNGKFSDISGKNVEIDLKNFHFNDSFLTDNKNHYILMPKIERVSANIILKFLKSDCFNGEYTSFSFYLTAGEKIPTLTDEMFCEFTPSKTDKEYVFSHFEYNGVKIVDNTLEVSKDFNGIISLMPVFKEKNSEMLLKTLNLYQERIHENDFILLNSYKNVSLFENFNDTLIKNDIKFNYDWYLIYLDKLMKDNNLAFSNIKTQIKDDILNIYLFENRNLTINFSDPNINLGKPFSVHVGSSLNEVLKTLEFSYKNLTYTNLKVFSKTHSDYIANDIISLNNLQDEALFSGKLIYDLVIASKINTTFNFKGVSNITKKEVLLRSSLLTLEEKSSEETLLLKIKEILSTNLKSLTEYPNLVYDDKLIKNIAQNIIDENIKEYNYIFDLKEYELNLNRNLDSILVKYDDSFKDLDDILTFNNIEKRFNYIASPYSITVNYLNILLEDGNRIYLYQHENFKDLKTVSLNGSLNNFSDLFYRNNPIQFYNNDELPLNINALKDKTVKEVTSGSTNLANFGSEISIELTNDLHLALNELKKINNLFLNYEIKGDYKFRSTIYIKEGDNLRQEKVEVTIKNGSVLNDIYLNLTETKTFINNLLVDNYIKNSFEIFNLEEEIKNGKNIIEILTSNIIFVK